MPAPADLNPFLIVNPSSIEMASSPLSNLNPRHPRLLRSTPAAARLADDTCRAGTRGGIDVAIDRVRERAARAIAGLRMHSNEYDMDMAALRAFVCGIRERYPGNPYHNFTHAFATLRSGSLAPGIVAQPAFMSMSLR